MPVIICSKETSTLVKEYNIKQDIRKEFNEDKFFILDRIKFYKKLKKKANNKINGLNISIIRLVKKGNELTDIKWFEDLKRNHIEVAKLEKIVSKQYIKINIAEQTIKIYEKYLELVQNSIA